MNNHVDNIDWKILRLIHMYEILHRIMIILKISLVQLIVVIFKVHNQRQDIRSLLIRIVTIKILHDMYEILINLIEGIIIIETNPIRLNLLHGIRKRNCSFF